MPNCSSCGKYIKPNEVFRREIYVGKSRRIYIGKRISFGNSNYYRKQNVCIECARAIDEANEKRTNQIKVFFLIVAIFIILYLISK